MENKAQPSYSRVAIEPCRFCWGDGINNNEWTVDKICRGCRGTGQVRGKRAMKERRKKMFMGALYDETGERIYQKPNRNRPNFYRLQSCRYFYNDWDGLSREEYRDVATYFNPYYALKLRDIRSAPYDELPAYRVISPNGRVVYNINGEPQEGDTAYSSTTYSMPWEY